MHYGLFNIFLCISNLAFSQINSLNQLKELYYKSPKEIHHILINKGYNLIENDDEEKDILRFYSLKTSTFVYKFTIDKSINLTYSLDMTLSGNDKHSNIFNQLLASNYKTYNQIHDKIIYFIKGKKIFKLFKEHDEVFTVEYSDKTYKK